MIWIFRDGQGSSYQVDQAKMPPGRDTWFFAQKQALVELGCTEEALQCGDAPEAQVRKSKPDARRIARLVRRLDKVQGIRAKASQEGPDWTRTLARSQQRSLVRARLCNLLVEVCCG